MRPFLIRSTLSFANSLTWSRSVISFSFNIEMNSTKIFPVAVASSTALWCVSSMIFKCLQMLSSVNLPRCPIRHLASPSVSTTVWSYGRFNLFAFSRINPVSNPALCATKTDPSQNFKNCGRISSIVPASFTISSVIVVSWVILYGIGRSGLTNSLNVSLISPSTTLTAPISIIRSLTLLNPVVSISNTT